MKPDILVDDYLLYIPLSAVFQITAIDWETKTFRARTNGSDVSSTIYYFSEIDGKHFQTINLTVRPIYTGIK